MCHSRTVFLWLLRAFRDRVLRIRRVATTLGIVGIPRSARNDMHKSYPTALLRYPSNVINTLAGNMSLLKLIVI